MEIKNLYEKDIKQIEGLLSELRKENPDIAYRIFEQKSEQEQRSDEFRSEKD